MSFQGDEIQASIILDAADMALMKEDVNLLISDDSGKELAPQLTRQAASLESSGFSFIG